MAVIRRSWKLMKGNFGKLLKLDLSFWWFYALEILLMLVAYADMLLPLIGIELPWPELVQTYAPLVVYQLLILLLYWWRGSQIQLTYACFYEAALPEDPETV